MIVESPSPMALATSFDPQKPMPLPPAEGEVAQDKAVKRIPPSIQPLPCITELLRNFTKLGLCSEDLRDFDTLRALSQVDAPDYVSPFDAQLKRLKIKEVPRDFHEFTICNIIHDCLRPVVDPKVTAEEEFINREALIHVLNWCFLKPEDVLRKILLTFKDNPQSLPQAIPGQFAAVESVNLFEAEFSGIAFTDELLHYLHMSCPKLKELHWRIENEKSLALIGQFTFLEILEVFSVNTITDAGFQHLWSLKHLQVLKIDHCYGVSDRELDKLQSLSELRELSIQATSYTFLKALSTLQYLVTLKLNECLHPTERDFEYLPAFRNLRSLVLSCGSTSLTPKMMEQVARVLTLQKLAVASRSVTDAHLDSLVALQGLQSLHIADYTSCTRAAVLALQKRLPQLRYVDILPDG